MIVIVMMLRCWRGAAERVMSCCVKRELEERIGCDAEMGIFGEGEGIGCTRRPGCVRVLLPLPLKPHAVPDSTRSVSAGSLSRSNAPPWRRPVLGWVSRRDVVVTRKMEQGREKKERKGGTPKAIISRVEFEMSRDPEGVGGACSCGAITNIGTPPRT